MHNRAITVYCLISVLWIFTRSIMAYGPSPFFDTDIPLSAYSASQVGYGLLTPRKTNSEIGIITKELIYCAKASALKHQPSNAAITAEASDLTFLMELIMNSNTLPKSKVQEEFLKIFNDKSIFYNSPKNEKTKLYPSGKDTWENLSIEQRKLAEKLIYIQVKMIPSENLKAVVLLQILEKKEGTTFENMKNLLKRSFFLLNDDYINAAKSYLQELHRKDNVEYENYINRFVNMPFYKIHSIADKTARIARKEYKNSLKNRASESYLKFQTFHRESIYRFINSLKQNPSHRIIIDQLFAEGLIERPTCTSPIYQVECNGVNREQGRTNIASPFALEYFQAHRSLLIEEAEEYIITVPLKFKSDASVNPEASLAQLRKWSQWATEFYNTDYLVNNKKVVFNFKFMLVEEGTEESINLRKCWNASRSSAECSLASQPDAKNFTLDIPKDVLLEEVGHHMGLTDEYQMTYYHFNLLGAEDSFMTAPNNYRIYPHHIEMILAPHFVCQ